MQGFDRYAMKVDGQEIQWYARKTPAGVFIVRAPGVVPFLAHSLDEMRNTISSLFGKDV